MSKKTKKKKTTKAITKKEESPKEILKNILKIYLISRIILIILMIISEILLNTGINDKYNHVLELFDNEHYLNIAKYGYTQDYEYAFFPLVPLLIRYTGKIGFLLINQLATITTSYIFYLISKKYLKKEGKELYTASLFYLISPISIFTCMFYTEAIFIFLTTLAYYLFLEKKHYFLLGITIGLSVLTRSLGSMLFFPIFIFMAISLFKKQENLKNIFITYLPATIISCTYPIYLYFKTNDLFYFINVQFLHWYRVKTSIFTIAFDSWNYITLDDPLFKIDYFLTFGLITFLIIYMIKNRKDKSKHLMYTYIIFTLISICSTIRKTDTALASMYRYIFGCFPIYFTFKNNYLTYTIIMLLTSFITIIFIMGKYFY